MGNKFEVEVKESEKELKHRLHHAITASSKERLQMLYWLKRNAITTRKELSQKLGRDESTIYRWLKRYRHGGLADLLDVKTPTGKKSQISEEKMNQLKERLSQPQGFKSYGEIRSLAESGIGHRSSLQNCTQNCSLQTKSQTQNTTSTKPKN